MKKLLILSFIGLTACMESEQQKYDRFLTELDCPVILIGKTDRAVDKPSVVVRDGKGRIRTITGGKYYDDGAMAAAVSDSRQIGDTLKPCK